MIHGLLFLHSIYEDIHLVNALVEPSDTYSDRDTSKLQWRQDDNDGVCFHKCQRIRLPCHTITQLNQRFRSSFSKLIPHIFGIFNKVDALMTVCNIGRVGKDGVEED